MTGRVDSPPEAEWSPEAERSPAAASPREAQSRTEAASPLEAESPAGERQVPFYCPYCGDEELRPAGSKPGQWECRSCARSFQLAFTGVIS